MPITRKRLTSRLRALDAEVEDAEIVQVNPPLRKPTSIRAASKDILLCADDEQRRTGIRVQWSYYHWQWVSTTIVPQ